MTDIAELIESIESLAGRAKFVVHVSGNDQLYVPADCALETALFLDNVKKRQAAISVLEENELFSDAAILYAKNEQYLNAVNAAIKDSNPELAVAICRLHIDSYNALHIAQAHSLEEDPALVAAVRAEAAISGSKVYEGRVAALLGDEEGAIKLFAQGIEEVRVKNGSIDAAKLCEDLAFEKNFGWQLASQAPRSIIRPGLLEKAITFYAQLDTHFDNAIELATETKLFGEATELIKSKKGPNEAAEYAVANKQWALAFSCYVEANKPGKAGEIALKIEDPDSRIDIAALLWSGVTYAQQNHDFTLAAHYGDLVSRKTTQGDSQTMKVLYEKSSTQQENAGNLNVAAEHAGLANQVERSHKLWRAYMLQEECLGNFEECAFAADKLGLTDQAHKYDDIAAIITQCKEQ